MSIKGRAGEQLRMFMTANEIKTQYRPHVGDLMPETSSEEDPEPHPETADELWQRKADESWDTGLANDLMEHGVQKPVHLVTSTSRVAGGHHRIAFMGEESPNELMPVVHHADFYDAKYNQGVGGRERKDYRYS